ncbi:MAG: N-6 DNA methylase [Streptosporangiaceae bacterium]
MVDDSGSLVPAAEIARLAGVTRAAVSNWRRRHSDFPEPAGGSGAAPLFALADVRQWLDRQGKGREVTDEVRLWQALRAEHGDAMIGALVAVGAELSGDQAEHPLTDTTAELVREITRERTPRELVTDLAARFVVSSSRSGGEHVSTPTLVRVVRHFAGTTSGTVYDPACGIGDLLFAVGGDKVGERFGQDVETGLTEFVRRRAALESWPGTVHVAQGDSLRADHYDGLKADLVVCDPPTGQADWGRDELLLDQRWEIGLPPKAEGELAWLQHCYFHTAPGGRAVLVLPASVAYRRSGRRIRSELVRNGLLHTMVALPGGLAAGHALPVHLWIVERPLRTPSADAQVQMIDLMDADLSKPISPTSDQLASVSIISLLDDEVDLTPSRYVAAGQPGHAAAYASTREMFEQRLGDLSGALPRLPEGDQELAATVNVNELIRGGLVQIQEDGQVVSGTDQLDTDFLLGFLRSAGNSRRNTSGSGTHRADPRGARVPQMDPDRQRRYGAVFRDLESFVQRLEETAKMGRRAVRLAHEGLTSGTLHPVEQSDEQEGVQ